MALHVAVRTHSAQSSSSSPLLIHCNRINEKPELAAKILLVGDASVGKTAFLTQFMGRAPKGKLDDTTSVCIYLYLFIYWLSTTLGVLIAAVLLLHAQMDRTIFMHGKQITLHLYELVRGPLCLALLCSPFGCLPVPLTFLHQSLARNTNRGKSPYRGMNGVVLFYSSNDVDSFANLHLWLEDVRR
jgi:hypothetical protein